MRASIYYGSLNIPTVQLACQSQLMPLIELSMETSRGLEQKAFMKNSNFLMVLLRHYLVAGDLMHLMGISNVLYVTKLLV